MTSAGPSTWARTVFAVAVSMLLVVTASATASADPQDGPTSITVSATVANDFKVTASGTLSDSKGGPIPGATVQGVVDGEPVAQSRTGDDGVYTLDFILPETLRTGEHQLVALFSGQDTLETSQAAATISAAEAAPPPDTRVDVSLDVSIAPSTVMAGELITVEGTISDSSGTPIAGAPISVLIDGEESKDSRTTSSDSGAFQTFAEIAPDRSPGKGSLVVSFAGNSTFTPGLKEFTLDVDEPSAAEAATPTVSATETARTSSSQSPTAAATPTDTTASTSTEGSTSEATVVQGAFSWFYVALILVGGAAVLVAAGLVFRGWYGRRTPTSHDDRSLDLLLEHDTDPDDPDSGGLGDVFADDAEVSSEDPSDTRDSPAPRRSLD